VRGTHTTGDCAGVGRVTYLLVKDMRTWGRPGGRNDAVVATHVHQLASVCSMPRSPRILLHAGAWWSVCDVFHVSRSRLLASFPVLVTTIATVSASELPTTSAARYKHGLCKVWQMYLGDGLRAL